MPGRDRSRRLDVRPRLAMQPMRDRPPGTPAEPVPLLTARSAPARAARGWGASSTSTWTGSSPTPRSRSATGRSPPGTPPKHRGLRDQLIAQGPDARLAGRRAVPGPFRRGGPRPRGGRAGRRLSRAGGLFRAARPQVVQDCGPRLPRPLAAASDLSRLPGRPAPSRGARRADRWDEHRRILRPLDRPRRRAAGCVEWTRRRRSGRPSRLDRRAARSSDADRRRLSDARSLVADDLGRRVAAGDDGQDAGLGPGGDALRARRADDRPPRPRRRPAGRRAPGASRRGQHPGRRRPRSRRDPRRPTTSSTSALARARPAVGCSSPARPPIWTPSRARSPATSSPGASVSRSPRPGGSRREGVCFSRALRVTT